MQIQALIDIRARLHLLNGDLQPIGDLDVELPGVVEDRIEGGVDVLNAACIGRD